MSNPKVYETASGLKFWMDLKSEGYDLQAQTIRTSDPDIFVVVVPSDGMEDTFLFQFKGKRIAFSKPSSATIRFDHSIDELRARNPDLDIIFSRVGQAEVPWFHPYANKVGDGWAEERFVLTADTDLGSQSEFQEITELFFELMSQMGDGPLGMFRGPREIAKVGFDIDLLVDLKSKGLING